MDNTVLNNGPQRTQKWDVLKFFMVFLVVLGHAADFYTPVNEQMQKLFLLVYAVHMPVFIFVSGLFSKRTVNEKRTDKILGYLILYFALKLIPFFYRFSDFENPGISFWKESGSPWFMLAIFAFNLITIAVKNYSPRFVLVFTVLLACFAGYDQSIGDFLALSRIIVFYPFFYLGYVIDREKLEKLCENRKIKIISAVILIAFIAVVLIFGKDIYWLRPLLTGRSPFAALKYASRYGYLLRLGYYAVISIVGFSVVALTPEKTRFGVAAKLGQRTLAVYAFHFFVLYLIFERFNCDMYIENALGRGGDWLIIPVSAAITVILSLKIFNKAVSFVLDAPLIKNSKK